MARNLDQELDHLTRLWQAAGESSDFLCSADPFLIIKSLKGWVQRKEQHIAVYFALQCRCRASEQERLRTKKHFDQDRAGNHGWLGSYLPTIAKGKEEVKKLTFVFGTENELARYLLKSLQHQGLELPKKLGREEHLNVNSPVCAFLTLYDTEFCAETAFGLLEAAQQGDDAPEASEELVSDNFDLPEPYQETPTVDFLKEILGAESGRKRKREEGSEDEGTTESVSRHALYDLRKCRSLLY